MNRRIHNLGRQPVPTLPFAVDTLAIHPKKDRNSLRPLHPLEYWPSAPSKGPRLHSHSFCNDSASLSSKVFVEYKQEAESLPQFQG